MLVVPKGRKKLSRFPAMNRGAINNSSRRDDKLQNLTFGSLPKMLDNGNLNGGQGEKNSANDCSGVGQRDFAVGQRLLNGGQLTLHIGQRF